MLVSLTARDFRNLAPLDFSPGAGSHLLLGGNGAGKTSLLEAVYVLATTRSFRTSKIGDCARHGAAGFHLAGEVERAARSRLEVGWRREPGGTGERTRSVNGNQTSVADHLEVMTVVAATGADAEILTGAPALRRRFLDRGVVSTRPGALESLSRYRRTLRNKRDLLSQQGGGVDPAELDTWNTLLATAAAEVIALRFAYTRRLEVRLLEVLEEAALPFPQVTLRYRPSPALELPRAAAEAATGDTAGGGSTGGETGRPVDRAALEAAILERLRGSVRSEVGRGQPLLGPHRDDLEVLWGGHPVRATVSAGERKALSLLLTAAHGRALAAAEREPIYLLDDLDAELSADTLAKAWRVFTGGRQLLVTSNRPTVWHGLEMDHRSHLRRGEIQADGVNL